MNPKNNNNNRPQGNERPLANENPFRTPGGQEQNLAPKTRANSFSFRQNLSSDTGVKNPFSLGQPSSAGRMDWSEDMGESSRQDDQTTVNRPDRDIEVSLWNPASPSGYKEVTERRNDRQVAGKKRQAAEMAPSDEWTRKKFQANDTVNVVTNAQGMPVDTQPTDERIWKGTDIDKPLPGPPSFVLKKDLSTKKGQELLMQVYDAAANMSPTGETITYVLPVLETSAVTRLASLIGRGRRPEEGPVRKHILPKKSSAQTTAQKKLPAPPGPPGPQRPSRSQKPTRRDRAGFCRTCDSPAHGEGDCPGGYDTRHGDVPVCPFCHTTSAGNMNGHTFDAADNSKNSGRGSGCVRIKEAIEAYYLDTKAQEFFIQHLIIGRKGKAPLRVYNPDNCFIKVAIEYSRYQCNGQMPLQIGSVWPLTKEDAVRHAAALRNWDSLAPADRPRSSLDSMSIDEIRQQYEAELIPAQVFDLHEDILGKMNSGQQNSQENVQPGASASGQNDPSTANAPSATATVTGPEAQLAREIEDLNIEKDPSSITTVRGQPHVTPIDDTEDMIDYSDDEATKARINAYGHPEKTKKGQAESSEQPSIEDNGDQNMGGT